MCEYCEDLRPICTDGYFTVTCGKEPYLHIGISFGVLGEVVSCYSEADINFCPMCGRDLRGGAE